MKSFTEGFLVFLIFIKFILTQDTEDKVFLKLQRAVHEKEANAILNECIYNNMQFTNTKILQSMYRRQWMKAVNLILDYLMDTNSEDTLNEIHALSNYTMSYLQNIKGFFANKKKNIVKLSPIFEWSQDNDYVKIRLKFSKNLESPGEKGIQNFKVVLNRTHLEVQGYKVQEDYVSWYYRVILLYEFAQAYTVTAYKETEGSYIIKFKKGTATMYWNFLDQPTADHSNMFTWFDVFTTFDDKAKYTEFREWTQDNLLVQDLEYHLKDKIEDKNNRMLKISKIAEQLVTKDYENKNYCNSPPGETICLLSNIYEWNYWLS